MLKGVRMIIITQNKDSVIIGDVTDLYISNGTTIKANLQRDPDTTYILGVYSTTDQAREVLLDMARHICDCDGQIYQMPPDQKPEPEPIPAKWTSQLSAHWDGLRESAS